ncbi:MAG: hypothetical protein ACOYT4_05400 [Nanoarchaeota archaeon]
MVMEINKKGAIELSIGTLVVIVLAMSMLILGLILVKNIFSGAKYNVDQVNDKVKDEINKLFSEDKKTIVYLPNSIAKIQQGESWGVAFCVKNLEKGTSKEGDFSYEVKLASSDCDLSEKEAMSWIKAGSEKESSIPIAPGQTECSIIRFAIPEGSPLCFLRYRINIQKDGKTYDSESFDVEVTA